jgi:uncharacterized membrane protein
MAVLCFVATYSIMIPIPATSGYFNIGNVFIIISGLVFGSIVAGGFGPAISDLIGGYYFSVPFTLIIKGCEGFVAGYVGGRLATAKLNRVILAWALRARALESSGCQSARR